MVRAMSRVPDMLVLPACRVELRTGVVHGLRDGTRLTTTELDVLRYLARHPNEPVGRHTLHREVWRHGDAVLSRALDTTVRRMRRKLEPDPRKPGCLITVHGVGYRLNVVAGRRDALVEAERLVAGRTEPDRPRGVPASWWGQENVLQDGVREALSQGLVDRAAALVVALLRLTRFGGDFGTARGVAAPVLAAGPSVRWRALVLSDLAPLQEGARAAESRTEALNLADSLDVAVRLRVTLTHSRSVAPERIRSAPDEANQAGLNALEAQALGVRASLGGHREDDFRCAVALATRTDPWEAAIITGNRAGWERSRGNLDASELLYRRAGAILEDWHDLWNLQRVWSSLATLLHQRLRLDEAEAAYQRALDLARQVSDAPTAAVVEANLACLQLDYGRTVDPAAMEPLLATFRREGNLLYECVVLGNQGVAWRLRGDLVRSEGALSQAIQVSMEAGSAHHRAEHVGELGTTLAAVGRSTDALRLLREAEAGLAENPSRAAIRARFLLRERALCERKGLPVRPEVEEALLRAADSVPAVPGTEWVALDRAVD